jgi:hypothetical protein
MKQQHSPIDIKTYEKGINSDSNKEMLGPDDTGLHVDALNMRSMSMDGDNLAKKKIKGEDLLFDNSDNRCFLLVPGTLSADYECMLTLEVNMHIIEVWASTEVGEFPFMRIDGQIVLMSEYFPIDINYPLQYDKNEACVGGEIYITNNATPPMVFSVKDLMSNSGMLNDGVLCNQKYFDDFNLDEYTIQTKGILYKPAFVAQVAGSSGSFNVVVGTSGLAVGSYSYSYRYVSIDGDRTPFSPITELIPVVRNNSSQFDPYFPNSRTFSDEPNVSSSTIYGNHIKIKYENDSEFSFIELRRDSWYAGDPFGNPPVSEIIASIPVLTGLNVIDVLDRAEALFEGAVVLDLAEQTSKYSSIRRAKSIRYFNERLYLMNIGYESKNLNDDITFVDNTDLIFPTIQKIGKEGHKHVYNAAMYKSNMRGERTGFAVVLFDDNNNPSYAKQIDGAENFPFPNRRDEISALSLGTSYLGAVKAANTVGDITLTNEVFDHYDSEFKTETSESQLISFEDNQEYATLHPTSQNDNTSNYPSLINDEVSAAYDDFIPSKPQAFGLDYYAQGAAFKGLLTYPDFTDGFSVVQTEPAKRVLAQGLGFYSLFTANDGLGNDSGKFKNHLHAYFPDLEHTSPDIYEDFLNSPTTYQIQCVSPLGYFSEVYSHINSPVDIGDGTRDEGADIITYARVLRDRIGIPGVGTINPGLGTDTGLPDPDGFGYVAYGKYTNFSPSDTPSFPSNNGTNNIFNVNTASIIATKTGLQEYLDIELSQDIYNEMYTAGDRDAYDDGVMNWREPLYVINLVKDVNINPGLTTQYKYTGNYIKFKSLVLESSGADYQTVELVSERWEDCIPKITGELYNSYNSLYRFVYLEDENGIEYRWLNAQFLSGAVVTALLVAMDVSIDGSTTVTDSSGTYQIFGIYKSNQNSPKLYEGFTLQFSVVTGYEQFTIVPLGYKVYVKYDNRIPVRIFGGDTYINDSVWSHQDNQYSSNGKVASAENEFLMNIPFPFRSYKYADNYRVWINSDILGGHNYSTDKFRFSSVFGRSAFIRQLILMWTAETRCNLSFQFNNESPDKAVSDQTFPLINYIPRPYKWKTGNESERTTFEQDNHLRPDYFNDYGYEWNLWPFGGFRFLPQVNIDYSKSQTTDTYTSVPLIGYTEQTDFCTRIVWSQKRPVNVQNSDTVKTFPVPNYYDISDDTGCIKFAWSALSEDKGNNLYAFTDSGICLLVIDKRIIHEINANELATVGSDIGGILNQLWIDRSIGMSDETWRSWAEYSNAIFFVNNTSAYSFAGNSLTEISKTGFFDLLNTKFISNLGIGYSSKLCGGFNVLNKEYIMSVLNNQLKDAVSTLIYGIDQSALQCQSSYLYDKYLYIGNKLYGMKDSETYQLGVGNELNGDPIECYVAGVSDKEIYSDKEFIRIRVNSNSKPEKIYFYDSYDDYKTDTFSSVVDSVLNPLSIKDYFGYECYIPRKLLSPYYRQQGRLVIFKIVSTSDEEFLVTNTGVQYKMLK